MTFPSTVENVGPYPFHPHYELPGVTNGNALIFDKGYHDPLKSTTVNPSHFCRTDTTNDDSPSHCDRKIRSTVKPTDFLRGKSTISAQNAKCDLNFDGGPQEMRDMLAGSRELESVDDSLRDKYFSKKPKAKVTSSKSREASDSRRKHEARFTCPFKSCNGDFTRKHNLNSECNKRFNHIHELHLYIFHSDHLKAHCGVTNFICKICQKTFTTLPVLKRHINTCKKKQNPGNEHLEDAPSILEHLT